MENPWPQLPTDAPRVLSPDRWILEAFNARYADKRKLVIQTRLLPQPFIGNPEARVYLLILNRGYSPDEDDGWHAKSDLPDRHHRRFSFTRRLRSLSVSMPSIRDSRRPAGRVERVAGPAQKSRNVTS